MDAPLIVTGIIPENQLDSLVSLEDIRLVVCDALKVICSQLRSFYEPLISEVAERCSLTTGIEMQIVCKSTLSTKFLSAVQGVVNGLGSLSNIKLILTALYLYSKQKIRCALLSLEVIQRSLLAANIDQHQFFSDGVLLERDHIKRLLRSINRFIPDKVLQLWIERNSALMTHAKVLTPDEFLFLVSNTRDRSEAIGELPYGSRSLARDPGNKTYFLEETVGFPTAPEKWLQRHSDQVTDYSRLIYVGQTNPGKAKLQTQKTEKQLNSQKVKEELDDFKQALRNPKLIGEIKQVLADSQHQLNTARLSGRLAYEEKHTSSDNKPVSSSDQFKYWRLNHGKQSLSQAGRTETVMSRVTSAPTLLRDSILASKKFQMYLPPGVLFPDHTKSQRPRSAVHWSSLPNTTARIRPFSGLSRVSSTGVLPSPSFVLGSSRPVTAGSRPDTGVSCM